MHSQPQNPSPVSTRMPFVRWLLVGCVLLGISLPAHAQRTVKRPVRAAPPTFRPGEFSGVFFDAPLSQLQGTRPDASTTETKMASDSPKVGKNVEVASEPTGEEASSKDGVWKSLISGSSIEDLVKESKTRLDSVITTPAKFAAGGFKDVRREFTLLASLMAIIDRYPDEIRWKSSAPYGQRSFAKMASNCKVGTQPVFNEAKLRHQDLAELLKGSKLSGTTDEVTWEDIADRGPSMQLLEWALREHLAPLTSNDKEFQNGQEEVLKYAELVAAYGQILQQEGMTDADDDTYVELAGQMVNAASEAARATKQGDAESARSAVSKIDQSCNKCHESYR
ncbi:Cytochrome C' [Pirellula sp. SH-Sr6A]|uniref:cytochrome c n=1 Tax=Pirellula sp. SH-Sr6A TaxID=1632865 RepID=UPI00078EEB1F|nr:cytochrome c [Pirellula sp. SH-Sr6A]AMV33637.1 Cytochrome C' [Pirellula sp. SH-Sr6A]